MSHCHCCPLEQDQDCEGEKHRPICDKVCAGNERYRDFVIRISKPDREEPKPYPPLHEQVWNATKAIVRAGHHLLTTGHLKVTAEEQEERLSICRSCEKYDADQVRCRECGCPLLEKTSWASESCPLVPPKWNSIGAKTYGCGGCGSAG